MPRVSAQLVLVHALDDGELVVLPERGDVHFGKRVPELCGEQQHTNREEHAPITCDTPIRRCAAVVGAAGAGKPEWGEVMRVVRLS